MAIFLLASLKASVEMPEPHARVEAQDAYEIKDDLKARGFRWSPELGVWTLRVPGTDKTAIADLNTWMIAMRDAGHTVRRG
jgi:hypothetical protein